MQEITILEQIWAKTIQNIISLVQQYRYAFEDTRFGKYSGNFSKSFDWLHLNNKQHSQLRQQGWEKRVIIRGVYSGIEKKSWKIMKIRKSWIDYKIF